MPKPLPFGDNPPLVPRLHTPRKRPFFDVLSKETIHHSLLGCGQESVRHQFPTNVDTLTHGLDHWDLDLKRSFLSGILPFNSTP